MSKKKKLPPVFIIRATISLRNFLVRLTKNMLPGNFIMLEEASSFWKSKAIEVAAQLRIADFLDKGPMHIDKLAELTQCHRDNLYRVLRFLSSEGIFKEVYNGGFRNTKLSNALRSGENSVRFFIMHHLSENNWKLTGDLFNCVKTGENSISHLFQMHPFEYLEKHPDKNDVFNRAMTETAEISGDIFVSSYSFGRFGIIADIGGGQGLLLKKILLSFPESSGILFDQKHVVGQALSLSQDVSVKNRITIIEGNFFDEIPVKADLYILKNILHDWNDADALKILKNLRVAMPAGSRLLIIETIIKSDNKPSFGKVVDMQMMIGTEGGKERTLAEFDKLIKESGLKITRVIPNATPFSFIEVQ